MTRTDILQPCVSVLSRMCHPAWPSNTLKMTQRVLPPWLNTCCGSQGRRRVLDSRCGWLPGVHFHSSAIWAALSTLDAKDRQGDQSSATHHLHDDPLSLQPRQKKHLRGTEKSPADFEGAMRTLQDLFGMSQEDAEYVIISSLSRNITEQDILHNLHHLHECGIAGMQVHRIPWILSHKPDVLSKKLVKLKEPYLFREHFEGLGFCYFSMERMTTYQKYFNREAPRFSHHPNRIYYLAERIQIPVELFTEKIGKPHKTLKMRIERLDSMIDMFHEYGISPEDIVSDLWVFGYSFRKAEERLRRAKELGCTELRPWMCRCSDKIFDRFCERYQCEKELMGNHESLFSYLSERLDCDSSLLEKVFQSNMIMKKVHISKFSKIIDLLLAEGITAKEIRSCMKVFQYSEERTAARIKELKKLGFFPFPMIYLIRTPQQFKEIVSQYRKRLKGKQRD